MKAGRPRIGDTGRITFLTGTDRGGGDGCLTGHIIHLIAIRESLPAPETRMKAGRPCFGDTSLDGVPRPWMYADAGRRRTCMVDRWTWLMPSPG
ncbi:MAG TPA: hypothetical protein VE871_13895 [Longimicrobium sp.]|nr:hypothetical protein [Longimicrobium sp.]